MSPFQIGTIAFSGLLLVATFLAVIRDRLTPKEGAVLGSLWVLTIGAVLVPDALTSVAGLLGIGRGADLLLYCAILVAMVAFAMIYSRLRKLQREMTVLVREIALLEARRSTTRPEGSGRIADDPAPEGDDI